MLGADNTTLIATTWIELISQNYQSKLPTQATALKKKQLSIPKAAQSRKCQCHLTLKSAAGFSSSDRENLLSNILVSMSRQCQKLQLLIDHMAVCLKNKFACASVCLCVCVSWLVFCGSCNLQAASAAACAAIIIMKCCSSALILLSFSSSFPCACCTPKRGTHCLSLSLSPFLSYTHLHLPRSNCHKILNANWRLCALRESNSNDRFAS